MKDLKVLKLEFKVYGQYELGFDKIFDYAEKITTISSLLFTSEQFIMVTKIEWKDEQNIESIKRSIIIDDIIEISSEEKTSMYIVVGYLPPIVSEIISHVIKQFKCFLEFPIVNVKGRMTLPLVGTKEDLRELISYLEELNVEFQIVSFTNYFIKGRDMLSSLTPSQYECLEMAIENGFFEIPKRWMQENLPPRREFHIPRFLPISERLRRRYLKDCLVDFSPQKLHNQKTSF